MSLAASDRRLVRLSAAIALGRWEDLRAMRRSAPPGEPDVRWREILLQSHLFAGFPRTVEAASVLVEAGGLGTPEAQELAEAGPVPVERQVEGGERLFARIYAERAPAVRAALIQAHPLLERWILGHAYDRVLARPGVQPAVRELCAVAALAAQGQDRQLAAHARGAVRLGASPEDVVAAVEEVRPWLAPGDHARARDVVSRFGR
jgi:alkylhydroperoxidase/carboxymuconolactone decarboxylase family protein YurZ